MYGASGAPTPCKERATGWYASARSLARVPVDPVGARGLHLDAGPAYLFSDATVAIEDAQSGAMTLMPLETDPTAWISQSACLRLHVELGASGAASLWVVSSGVINWEVRGDDDDAAADDDDANPDVCSAATVKVGTELDNNPASYSLADSALCTNGTNMGTHMVPMPLLRSIEATSEAKERDEYRNRSPKPRANHESCIITSMIMTMTAFILKAKRFRRLKKRIGKIGRARGEARSTRRQGIDEDAVRKFRCIRR